MRLSSCRLRRSIHHALEARHARYTAMQAFVRGAMGPLQLASTSRSMLLHGSRPLLTGEKEKGRKLAEASGLACGSTGIEKCLENLMSIVFSRYGLKKYRQKYRHFSKCPRSAPRYVVGPEFSCAEPPKAELYASKLRATIDAKKQAANVVQADNGQWLLAPKAEPYTAQEASDAQQRIDKLNRALGKYSNVAPAAVLSDAPTATMAWGRSVARTLGYDVTFIQPNPDFHGVAVGGEAFVSASAEHPEIGLTSEAS